jgi:hypothetical protein
MEMKHGNAEEAEHHRRGSEKGDRNILKQFFLFFANLQSILQMEH